MGMQAANDGDATTNDGDAAANDGDATTNDGDAAANDGDATTNDGDAAANDGDAAANDGDATTRWSNGWSTDASNAESSRTPAVPACLCLLRVKNLFKLFWR